MVDPLAEDCRFMQEALAQARSVLGRTGDNPAVGCVIVRDGQVLARGATQAPGLRHAEAMAIEEADRLGLDLAPCDLYVTLEPCSFHGRTPPCSTLIARRHPRRVVVGCEDPHPKVHGSGIAELRAEGIEVVEGVLAEEVRSLLFDWFARWR